MNRVLITILSVSFLVFSNFVAADSNYKCSVSVNEYSDHRDNKTIVSHLISSDTLTQPGEKLFSKVIRRSFGNKTKIDGWVKIDQSEAVFTVYRYQENQYGTKIAPQQKVATVKVHGSDFECAGPSNLRVCIVCAEKAL